MKKSLEKALQEYAKVIKETPKDFDKRTQEDWDREGDTILRQSQERDTDHFIEDELFSMQKQKMERMDELRQTLRDIDAGKDVPAPEGAFPVTFKDGMFHVALSDTPEDVKLVTLGDVLIAPVWGLEYRLDPVSVPKWVRKRYALERAKSSIQFMADIQIMHDELNGYQADDKLQEIYGIRFAEYLGRNGEKAGIIMERIAYSVLKRLSIDCELGFVVKSADIHEDIEQMTDFFVQKKGTHLPVAVQFSIGDPDNWKLKRKHRRAARQSEYRTDVEKVVVVNIAFEEDIGQLFAKWAADAPKALTPADIIPDGVQEHICFKIIRRIYPTEESKAVMRKIQHYLGVVRD